LEKGFRNRKRKFGKREKGTKAGKKEGEEQIVRRSRKSEPDAHELDFQELFQQIDLILEIEEKGGERKVTFFFSHFFHLFRQFPPLKSPNPNCGRYTHPPTMIITPLCSTPHPTWWWWFYWDWVSLIRMISYHGYQKLSAPPTSKPSCDRYTQPPKIKPTPPCSPDNALQAHMSIMVS